MAAVLLEGLALINAQPIRFRANWLPRLLGQLPIAVLKDCVRLIHYLGTCLAAGRREQMGAGRIVPRPFDPEHEERAGEAWTRQALVVLGICLPPNSFAIIVECPPDQVEVHDLLSSGPARSRRDPEWPL